MPRHVIYTSSEATEDHEPPCVSLKKYTIVDTEKHPCVSSKETTSYNIT